MTQTFYAIDRSLDVVNGNGHPAIVVFHRREARDGFVDDSPSRHKATKVEAEVLYREWYKLKLHEAMRKGLV